MIKQSFTLRVLILSFIVLALPLLVDSFIFFQNAYYDTIRDAKIQLRQAANFRSYAFTEIQPIKQVFLKEVDFLLNLGERLERGELDELNQELEKTAEIGGNFQLFVLGLGKEEHYEILASSLPELRGEMATSFRKLARIVETGEGSFGGYYYAQEDKKYIPFVYVARLIFSKKNDKPLGILLAGVDIEVQLDDVVSSWDSIDDIHFAILNVGGVIFSSTDKNLLYNYFEPITKKRREELSQVGELGGNSLPSHPLPISKSDDPPFFEFIFDGKTQIAYRTFIPEFSLSILAYSPKGEFFGKAIRHFLLIYLIYGLILVVGGGLVYWLSLWISRPLRQLSHLMGEVSQGNLDVRFKKQPYGFEINLLGEIFNDTLDKLLTHTQNVEDQRVKKEIYEHELAIARIGQHNLLLSSTAPMITGAEIAGTYLPAAEVGGDFYGYLRSYSQSGEETTFIYAADAAGKGLSPCLYALSARSLLRSYATILGDPADILDRTNNAFIQDTGDTGMFITVVGAVYHAESKILTYYSCGHVPPIVRRADGHLETLHHSGMALGLKESKGYNSLSCQLRSGDLVIFYTDGLTDAVNDKHQPFSEKKLRRLLQQRHWSTAEEGVKGVIAEVQNHIGRELQDEEMIVIALKVE